MRTTKDDLKGQKEQRDRALQMLAELEHQFGGAQEEDLREVHALPRNEVLPPPEPTKSARNPYGFHDIITFLEHPYFLGEYPTPMQKVILISFFKGSPGNQDLKIDDQDDGGCGNCVWNYAREREEEVSKVELAEGVWQRPNSRLPIDNIPCYDCSRMDCALKNLRFKQLKEEAPDEFVAAAIEKREEAPPEDKFQNQAMLLESEEMDESVRNQIKDKLSAKKRIMELILVLGRGAGKALDLDTPILTTAGWKTAGTVEAGDFVYGPDGAPTQVTDVSPVWRNRVCYEVKFDSGESLVADEGHEWVVTSRADRKNSSRRGAVVPKRILDTAELAESVKIRDKEYNWHIDVAQPLQTSEADLPVHPYLMGIWLGDGTAQNGYLTTADHEVIERIAKLTSYRPWKQKRQKYGYCVGKNESGKAFVTQLREMNLLNNKHIPREYLQGSEEQRRWLLRGLVDSDGHIDKRRGHAEISVKDERIAEGIRELVVGLGMKCGYRRGNAYLNGKIAGCRTRISFVPPLEWEVASLARKVQALKSVRKNMHGKHIIKSITKMSERRSTVCLEVDNTSHQFLAGYSLIPTHNSYMVSVIALYMTYLLLRMGHPQKHFGLMDDAITILNVANSEDQSKSVFRKIYQLAINSPFFAKYVCHETLTELHLMTPRDLEVYEERLRDGHTRKIGSVIMRSGTSNSATQVGGNVFCLIIDEMAEMSEGGGDDLAEELYNKLSPSLSRFRGEGRIVCISNPLYEHGYFFQIYEKSYVNPNVLMFRCPTGFVNPNVTREYLEAERAKDASNFSMQFLAKFSGASQDPFIPEDCVDRAFRRLADSMRSEVGSAAHRYYAHLDPSYNSDMYALVILHAEQTRERDQSGRLMKKIEVDHIHVWKPGPDKTPINVDEVNRYVLEICRKFNMVQVSYDHWNSDASITYLRSRGINAVRRQFSPQYQDMIFDNLKDLFMNDMIDLYGSDTHISSPEWANLGEVSEAKRELKMLQKVIKNNRPKIEVPKNSGVNDDIADCLAAAAYECLNNQQFKRLPASRIIRPGRMF